MVNRPSMKKRTRERGRVGDCKDISVSRFIFLDAAEQYSGQQCEGRRVDNYHFVPMELKCRCIRSTSGLIPVNSRKASAAWNTAMPLPFMVRQPRAFATRNSSVSSGK